MLLRLLYLRKIDIMVWSYCCSSLAVRQCSDGLIYLQAVGARDQRVTAFVVSVLLGASVLMAPILKLVPFAVLFGVFLYMGISGWPLKLQSKVEKAGDFPKNIRLPCFSRKNICVIPYNVDSLLKFSLIYVITDLSVFMI
jgi:hypothetical protein